jgi:hypothetical protein
MSKRGNGEGSIYYQASRERYPASYYDINGKRQIVYAKTRTKVGQLLAAALTDKQKGLPRPSGALTVEKYLADWLEDTVKPGRRKGTYLR